MYRQLKPAASRDRYQRFLGHGPTVPGPFTRGPHPGPPCEVKHTTQPLEAGNSAVA